MSSRLRTVALLSVASLALHQLRYRIAHGEDTATALAREGHAYLDALAPLAACLLGAAVLDFVLALIARRDPGATRGRRWIAITLTLLAIYVCQESLEGLLASGHAGGLAAAFGNGGWVALPLAAALAAVVTLALRGAEAALARRARAPSTERRPLSASRRPRPVERRLIGVLAAHLAGRGPPAASLA